MNYKSIIDNLDKKIEKLKAENRSLRNSPLRCEEKENLLFMLEMSQKESFERLKIIRMMRSKESDLIDALNRANILLGRNNLKTVGETLLKD